MTKYTIEIYGYGIHKGSTHTIDAPNDNIMRRDVIRKYGHVLYDPRTGLSIYKEGDHYIYGGIRYGYNPETKYGAKRWYWNSKGVGSGWDFEIDPVTGGKMERRFAGYDVEYTTRSGTPVKEHFNVEIIEHARDSIITHIDSKYKNAKTNFKFFKKGKYLGTLNLGNNGRWIWTSASGTKYNIKYSGYISSQKR